MQCHKENQDNFGGKFQGKWNKCSVTRNNFGGKFEGKWNKFGRRARFVHPGVICPKDHRTLHCIKLQCTGFPLHRPVQCSEMTWCTMVDCTARQQAATLHPRVICPRDRPRLTMHYFVPYSPKIHLPEQAVLLHKVEQINLFQYSAVQSNIYHLIDVHCNVFLCNAFSAQCKAMQ